MLTTKNVYVVFTEYQLLQAINIATSVYKDSYFNNIIYIIREGKRMNGINRQLDYNEDNIVFKFLDLAPSKIIADTIKAEKPNHFLIFQDTTPINVYLGHTISKQGAKISLGPDGYGSYEVLKKRLKLLSIIKESFTNNLFLIKNKLFTGKIHIFDYTYGNNDFTKNIWVTHPKEYVHRGKNKVNVIELPSFNEKCLMLIKKLFNFKLVFPTQDSIYFFNQPLWVDLAKVEYDFLCKVLIQFPNKNVILKLHPLTSAEMKSKYKALDKLQVIDADFPAEIIISSLSNCIIYSGFSTVLITENKKCNYYFNYPVFRATGHRIIKQIGIPALNHIKMISTPEEMEFPLL